MRFFPLFAILVIFLAIPATVIFNKTSKIFEQHASYANCNTLTISGPVMLDKTTVAIGNTLHGTVTYTNTNNCYVYVKEMAVGVRPPNAPRSDPYNQYG